MCPATHILPSTSPGPSADRQFIRVRGARVHNLRNIDVDIPQNQFVVITGPSGSGKSSLALDTVFAEGQRQYIETLSVYARQFFHQVERPDVESIDGLEPTVCIDQRRSNRNPRSTVATVTEIYDYLRVLFARIGIPHCYQCAKPIAQQTPQQICQRLMRQAEGTRVMVLAPMARGRRGAQAEVFARIRRLGMIRVRVGGTVYDLDQVPEQPPRGRYDIDAVVDRIVIRPGIEGRLGESIELAIRHAEGLVRVCCFDIEKDPDQWEENLFSTRHACPYCGISYAELEPRTFSFNSPYGVCPTCEGLGAKSGFDPELVVPDLDRSLADDAIAPWRKVSGKAKSAWQSAVAAYLTSRDISWDTALAKWPPELVREFLYGAGKANGFGGVLVLLEQEFATTTRRPRLAELEKYRAAVRCSDCGGSRLRREANSVLLDGNTIGAVTAMSVADLRCFLEALEFTDDETIIATPLLREMLPRLSFLEQVGVGYLTLDRPTDSLSGGELQRVRLATSVGSGLVGVCYVLDEPSIGLHPRDNDRLIAALNRLRDAGNSVLVVEHDEGMIRHADHLIDMGPGAGHTGGQIVAQGTADDLAQTPRSITGQYLSGNRSISTPQQRRRIAKSRALVLQGAATNNLKAVDVTIPLGALICVTGVSGSGKSSLINETLAPALGRRLGTSTDKPGPFASLHGTRQVDKVIQIDQTPIGRTPRSNPATYIGVFDDIRKVFAATRAARQRGFSARRFSFNVKGGRCDQCLGQGQTKIEMKFLPDLYVTCSQCKGARFNRQTLQVRYRDQSIAQVLDMSVDEACEFFANVPNIFRALTSLQQVGLGYLHLGQPCTTLSGGEAQRVKLATQLARAETGKTLYLLDEPTTGLHFDDVRRLLVVLNALVDRGNTVLVIEHHLDVMKTADWIIDLGPEGGEDGGYLVAAGTPEQIAQVDTSHTGRFLRHVLEQADAS